MPINVRREGWPFVAVFGVATAGLFTLAQPLGWIGLILTVWCALFFRDPDRVVPAGAGLVISPADGVILPLENAPPPAELDMGDAPLRRISVFMNVFDCHVNRAPVAGTVSRASYRPGAFFNASFDKASVLNERRALCLEMADGRQIAVVQIAGLIARRILCWANEGQSLAPGERFGMIRFGSRVDVYLPPGTRILVSPGQRAVAGETVIADLDSNEPDRGGAAV
jgi:phosphatidylserine decarboxylase